MQRVLDVLRNGVEPEQRCWITLLNVNQALCLREVMSDALVLVIIIIAMNCSCRCTDRSSERKFIRVWAIFYKLVGGLSGGCGFTGTLSAMCMGGFCSCRQITR